jgi:hypothetical protein
MVKHLVARRAQRANSKVDSLRHADSNQNLPIGIVAGGISPLEIIGYRFSESGGAEILSVVRTAVVKAGHRGAGNVPRGIEIGLAATERNNIVRLRNDVEKFPDSAFGQFRHMPCDSLSLSHLSGYYIKTVLTDFR